jgi:hypothetical protein
VRVCGLCARESQTANEKTRGKARSGGGGGILSRYAPACHLRGQCVSVEGEAAALFIDLHVPPGSIGAVPLLTQRLLPRGPP